MDGVRADLVAGKDASSDLRQAQQDAKAAHRDTHDPVWFLASWLPPVRTVRGLASVANDLAQHALPPVVEVGPSVAPRQAADKPRHDRTRSAAGGRAQACASRRRRGEGPRRGRGVCPAAGSARSARPARRCSPADLAVRFAGRGDSLRASRPGDARRRRASPLLRRRAEQRRGPRHRRADRRLCDRRRRPRAHQGRRAGKQRGLQGPQRAGGAGERRVQPALRQPQPHVVVVPEQRVTELPDQRQHLGPPVGSPEPRAHRRCHRRRPGLARRAAPDHRAGHGAWLRPAAHRREPGELRRVQGVRRLHRRRPGAAQGVPVGRRQDDPQQAAHHRRRLAGDRDRARASGRRSSPVGLVGAPGGAGADRRDAARRRDPRHDGAVRVPHDQPCRRQQARLLPRPVADLPRHHLLGTPPGRRRSPSR